MLGKAALTQSEAVKGKHSRSAHFCPELILTTKLHDTYSNGDHGTNVVVIITRVFTEEVAKGVTGAAISLQSPNVFRFS